MKWIHNFYYHCNWITFRIIFVLFVPRIAAANNKANHSARTKSLTLRFSTKHAVQVAAVWKQILSPPTQLSSLASNSSLSRSVIFPLSTHFPADTQRNFLFNLSQAERKFELNATFVVQLMLSIQIESLHWSHHGDIACQRVSCYFCTFNSINEDFPQISSFSKSFRIHFKKKSRF